ncbi:hypothetical protein SUDANB58_05768 (plasmid) [Streptomyces sp. enrichment culture]|uniref:GIY-YIG nuclease family protein n=1 Tax=Streptomyces sp. enrichment culture TaxID=1795815 RepID=UPI003F559467
MARQKWVYVVGAAEMRPVKIGSAFDVERRLGNMQVASPYALRVLWRFQVSSRSVEKALHDHLRPYWVRGEWFDFGEQDPVAMVAGSAVALGHWRPPVPELPPSAPNWTGTPEPVPDLPLPPPPSVDELRRLIPTSPPPALPLPPPPPPVDGSPCAPDEDMP